MDKLKCDLNLKSAIQVPAKNLDMISIKRVAISMNGEGKYSAEIRCVPYDSKLMEEGDAKIIVIDDLLSDKNIGSYWNELLSAISSYIDANGLG